MNERRNEITQAELERELRAMTEAQSTEQADLWRAALEQAREETATGRTRRVPGRRRLDLRRNLGLAEMLTIVIVVVGLGGLLMMPTLGRARSAVGSAASPPVSARPSVDSMPTLDARSEPPLAAELGTQLASRQIADADAGLYEDTLDTPEQPDQDRVAMNEASPEASSFSRSGAAAPEGAADAQSKAGADRSAAQPATAERMIAVRTEISLIVTDAERALRDCEEMLDASRGEFVEHTRLRGPAGNRWGEITLRVAAQHQDDAARAIRQLGEVESESRTAEDLTPAIADADARLRSLRQVEGELSDLLQRRENDSLDDIVTAQRELGRTRGEIESMEARLRVQRQRVRLATVHITLRERFDSTPGSLPSYWRTVESAGRDAMTLLDRVLYVVVVSAPFWLAALVVWLVSRLLRRGRSVE